MVMSKTGFTNVQRCARAAIAMLMFTPFAALALGPVDWIGADGNWEDGTQWSSGATPGVADDVTIGGAVVVSSSGLANEAMSVHNAATLMVSGGLLDIFSLLFNEGDIITAGGRLESNSLINDSAGDVRVSGGASELSVVINLDNYGAVTVSESATANVGNLTNFSLLEINTGGAVASETLATTTGAQTRIDDAGTAVEILGDITNHGTFAVGNGASAMAESITNSGAVTVDESLVEANSMINATGGSVALSGVTTNFRINGNITNDGTLTAEANATADIVSIDNGNVFEVFGGAAVTLESIDNASTGRIDIHDLASRLVLTDNLENDGNVSVAASGALEALSISTGGSLTVSSGAAIVTASITNKSTGTVTIEGPTTSVELDNNFQNAGTVSISAASSVTAGSVVNSGEIAVDAQAALTTTTFVNATTGLTSVTGAGSSVEVAGVLENSGSLHIDAGAVVSAGHFAQLSGQTALNGGTLIATVGGINIVDGRLDGVGSFTAGDMRAFAAAEIAPGTAATPTTTWDIDANAIFGGTLFIDISATGFDVLDITGDALVDGVLDISLLDGYAPALGSTFDIVLAATVAGAFSEEILPVFDGRTFAVLVGADFVRLTVTAVPIPAALYLLLPSLALLCGRRRAAIHRN